MIQVLIAQVDLANVNEFGMELGFQDSLLFDRSLLSTTSTNTPGYNFNNGNGLGNSGSATSLATAPMVAGQALSNFGRGKPERLAGLQRTGAVAGQRERQLSLAGLGGEPPSGSPAKAADHDHGQPAGHDPSRAEGAANHRRELDQLWSDQFHPLWTKRGVGPAKLLPASARTAWW